MPLKEGMGDVGKVRLFWPGKGGAGGLCLSLQGPSPGEHRPFTFERGEVPVAPMAGGSLLSLGCSPCSGTGGPLVPPGRPEVSQPQGLQVLKYPWVVPTCPGGLCLPWGPVGGSFCPGSRECVCLSRSFPRSAGSCLDPRGPHIPGVPPLAPGVGGSSCPPRGSVLGSCVSHKLPSCPGGYLHVSQGLRVPRCDWGAPLGPGVPQGLFLYPGDPL